MKPKTAAADGAALSRLHERNRQRFEAGICQSCDRERQGKSVWCDPCRLAYAEEAKRRRQDRRENGLCIYCSKPNDNPKSDTCCLACRDKNKARYDRLAQRRRVILGVRAARIHEKVLFGACITIRCKNWAAPGQEKCQDHLDPNFRRKYGRRKQQEYIDRCKARGVCWYCGFKTDATDGGICTNCRMDARERENEIRKGRALEGLCPCGSRTGGKFVTCAKCRARSRRWERRKTRDRIAMGHCIKCGDPVCPRSTRFCEKHRVSRLAYQKAWKRKQINRGAGAHGKPIK